MIPLIEKLEPKIWMRLGVAVALALFFVLAGGPETGMGSAYAQTESTSIAPKAPGSSVRPPATQKWGEPAAVPNNIVPQPSKPTIWGRVRLGEKGIVSIPNRQAATLVQAQGQYWREFRLGFLVKFGAWLLIGIVVILALFFFARGRIRIEHGFSGRTVTRFKTFERFTHWLTAVPFVVLALTGLNLLYGRQLLLPIIGYDAFSAITVGGKYLHNFMAYAFILGLVLMVIVWVRHNIWDKYDLGWILSGGGLFKAGIHPPARKFNAGQKILFWLVILGGASISYSGLALMFPFDILPFAPTFKVLNMLGFDLPTALEPIQEMQLLQAWHTILGLVLMTLIIAHIYIGTLGMEGAIDAMWAGEVDENWAREHHSAWVAELKGEPEPEPINLPQPTTAEQETT